MGFQIPVAYPPAPIVSFSDEQSSHPVLFRLNAAPLFFASSIETTEPSTPQATTASS
jgi:hypothetical protein